MGSERLQQHKITDYQFKDVEPGDGVNIADSEEQTARGISKLVAWFPWKSDRMSRLRTWMTRRVSWSEGAERRGKRALDILSSTDQIQHIAPGHYSVESQSQPGLWYDVRLLSTGRWVCNCPDHVYRKAQCKHILSVTAHVVDRDAMKILNVEDNEEDVDNNDNDDNDNDDNAYCSKTAVRLPEPKDEKKQKKKSKKQQQQSTGKKDTSKDLQVDDSDDRIATVMAKAEAIIDEIVTKGLLPLPEPRPNLDNLETDPDGAVHIRLTDHGAGGAPPVCRKKGCNSTSLSGYDHYTRANGNVSKRWKCHECGSILVYRCGMEGMRCEMEQVCDMFDFNSLRMSPKEISQSLSRKGFQRHPTSIYRTLKKYTFLLFCYTLRIPLNHLGDRVRADEIIEKIGGEDHYIFGSTDAKTRFLLSQDISDRKKGADVTRMLMQCILRAGKDPVELITDLLASFQVAFEALLAPKNALDDHSVHIADPDSARKSKSKNTPGGAPADISGRRAAVKCVHINDAGISKHDKKNNNAQERFNGTQRTFYVLRRGVKRVDSYLFYLFAIWYNFVRVHSSLGCTPAQAAGVMIHGMDMWRTLIENACVEAWRGA